MKTEHLFLLIITIVVIFFTNVNSYADFIAVSQGNQCSDSSNQDQGIYSFSSDGTQKWFFKLCNIWEIIQLSDGSLIAMTKPYAGAMATSLVSINTDGTQKWSKDINFLSNIYPENNSNSKSKIVWDIYNDGKKGVPEAIDALESATNISK